ncbi:MAG: DUF3842 family protein [Treponema sp.]|jgi:hypothetical protein|nr:DUF3842 family protein [Treponema sp.]
MNKPIVVIDGMGGGIGAQLISRLREILDKQQDIIALGANFGATERMLKAGATRGATGENAIRVSVRLGGFIVGPIGIVIPNSMMGEITPIMADAILASPCERILLPVKNEHFTLPGVEVTPLSRAIELAADVVKERLAKEDA